MSRLMGLKKLSYFIKKVILHITGAHYTESTLTHNKPIPLRFLKIGLF